MSRPLYGLMLGVGSFLLVVTWAVTLGTTFIRLHAATESEMHVIVIGVALTVLVPLVCAMLASRTKESA